MKKVQKYTRTPWRATSDHGCKTIGGAKSPGQQSQYRNFASTHGLHDDAEDYGNAQLMASAPRLLAFTKQLAGYGCAGVGQDADDPSLCGKCGPCEANAFLKASGFDRAKAV